MADFKLKLYMPGPLGKQMIFAETTSPYFSGYITNGKNKIKVRSPFEPIGKTVPLDSLLKKVKYQTKI